MWFFIIVKIAWDESSLSVWIDIYYCIAILSRKSIRAIMNNIQRKQKAEEWLNQGIEPSKRKKSTVIMEQTKLYLKTSPEKALQESVRVVPFESTEMKHCIERSNWKGFSHDLSSRSWFWCFVRTFLYNDKPFKIFKSCKLTFLIRGFLKK